MKDYHTAILFVILVAQTSALALNRKHDAVCTTCPAGYSISGNNCLQDCPADWTKQGPTCTPDYRRGKGFPILLEGQTKCEAENGAGNCQIFGLKYYPKCKAGYTLLDCCTCRAPPPKCRALGFGGQANGKSCIKKVTTC